MSEAVRIALCTQLYINNVPYMRREVEMPAAALHHAGVAAVQLQELEVLLKEDVMVGVHAGRSWCPCMHPCIHTGVHAFLSSGLQHNKCVRDAHSHSVTGSWGG